MYLYQQIEVDVREYNLDVDYGFEAVSEASKAHTDRLAQDKDVKDKKGTQPKKYYSGLKKDVKDKRDSHFKSKIQPKMTTLQHLEIRHKNKTI